VRARYAGYRLEGETGLVYYYDSQAGRSQWEETRQTKRRQSLEKLRNLWKEMERIHGLEIKVAIYRSSRESLVCGIV